MRIEELKSLVLQIRKEMKQAKIPCGIIDEVKIARKNAKYFAITKLEANGKYSITFSGIALLAGKKSLYNTIYHELCHTCRGCLNHGEKFNKYGDMVYKTFGQKIETYATQKETETLNIYKPWMNKILFMI